MKIIDDALLNYADTLERRADIDLARMEYCKERFFGSYCTRISFLYGCLLNGSKAYTKKKVIMSIYKSCLNSVEL